MMKKGTAKSSWFHPLAVLRYALIYLAGVWSCLVMLYAFMECPHHHDAASRATVLREAGKAGEVMKPTAAANASISVMSNVTKLDKRDDGGRRRMMMMKMMMMNSSHRNDTASAKAMTPRSLAAPKLLNPAPEARQKQKPVANESERGPAAAPEQPGGDDRVLHYYGGERGQGLGNTVNGLWVAHIFASRFDRRVCVHWPEFEKAFQRKRRERGCASPLPRTDLHSWNFGEKSTYKQLNETIGGSRPHVSIDGNDWPERLWPPMESYLTDHCEPTAEFQRMLPPGCEHGLDDAACGVDNVLHLRMGDTSRDVRGIFSCKTPYEILKNAFKLEDYAVLTDKPEVKKGLGLDQSTVPAEHSEGLASWLDWVKILTARRRVFHTPSGFSESALRVAPRRKSLLMGAITSKCDADRTKVGVRTESWIVPRREWMYSDEKG